MYDYMNGKADKSRRISSPKRWHSIQSRSSRPKRLGILVLAVLSCICSWRYLASRASTAHSPWAQRPQAHEQALQSALEACRLEHDGRNSAPVVQKTVPGAILGLETADDSGKHGASYNPSFQQNPLASLNIPDQTNCTLLDESAEFMPDFVYIPFEEAVTDEELVGWEDDWMAHAMYDVEKWGRLLEPKIDFVYLWVNGSDQAFQAAKRPYEITSPLNDPEGLWLDSHGVNRYRDWDELRYSIRSVDQFAGHFVNKVQILVNDVHDAERTRQEPQWLKKNHEDGRTLELLAQKDYFDEDKTGCLPTFNSLTMENQIFNTPSNVDLLHALSDDMLLSKSHAASDLFSPLFGPTMGFKTSSWSQSSAPTRADSRRFGEKPYLIYTSWLLNRRFGERKRKGQTHFGHSLSRKVMREAIKSFPRPEYKSACRRFRGEPGFQLYSWYLAFHYTIERHREVLLWSYIMQRSDIDEDGYLSWDERQKILAELEEGMSHEDQTAHRVRQYYNLSQVLEGVGLEAPKVNTDIIWTSLDGPVAIQDIECLEFDVDTCLAPGFSTPSPDERYRSPMFTSATIFDRVAHHDPKCGDCLTKLLLNRARRGLNPMLPHADGGRQARRRETVVKALMRYRYTVINPDALFVMVTDAEQVENVLLKPMLRAEPPAQQKRYGQLCLNDDVASEDEEELQDLRTKMKELYEGLLPQRSRWERDV